MSMRAGKPRMAARLGRCIGGAILVLAGLAAGLPASAAIPLLEQGGVPTLAPLLERVTPAVVNIAVLSRAPVEANPLLQDPFFRRFFNLPEGLPQVRPRISAGSGVIVDAERGYVVTNHHVVENAAEIAVTLKDRRQVEAKLVGSDPGTDIAVLKIDPKGLTAVAFGDADSLRVGDFVVAIGNPFGLGQTVTSGIVSALGRSGLRPSGYEDFIQTDASINPGNSGGALINLVGELVGINTAIVAPSGGNVGIGFAVPSNMARSVMEQLIRNGEIRRGRLGVAIQDVTPDIAEALGLERATGAIVTSVEPGSPAARAGIQARDVVVAVDGESIEDASALRNKVGLTSAGRTVELRLIRAGRAMNLKVRVEERRTGG